MVLPHSIVCFKSVHNQKFLRYRDGGLQSHGLLQFSGDKATDPFAQFQVVNAKPGSDARFVHLLSRYTNKYLVRWSPNSEWISASADEPNEDHANWGCTLFEPSVVHDDNEVVIGVRLKHVQLNNYACLSTTGTVPFDSCLFAGSPKIDPKSYDIFDVIDWSSIHKLPKTVAFRGDNGKYLGACLEDGVPYLKFSYPNPNVKEVAQEVTTSPDGTVMIKSKYYEKYWGLSDDDWIVVDVDEPTSANPNALFRVNVVAPNVVALLNMSNTWYCKRLSGSDDHKNLLSAATESVDACCLLEITSLSG